MRSATAKTYPWQIPMPNWRPADYRYPMPPASSCPVPSAHRRLMDCHVHWHAAADTYMDPESFRLNLNSLIQSLRNVTFLLQSQKRELPSFDTWYAAWQLTVKDDPVMRWAVKARNRIVKQSDLEIHSKAVVRLSFDWLNEIEDVLEVPPHYTTHQTISALLAAAPQPIRGIISIERRWVDVELPTRELLDATRYSYGHLATVIQMAHNAASIPVCDLATRTPDCVGPQFKIPLQCMHKIDDNRRLVVDLSSMTKYTEEMEILHAGDIPREVTGAKYGKAAVSGNAIERVPQVTEMAKRMLSVDKELATVAWLLRGAETAEIFALPMPDQRAKLIQMNRLADLVEQVNADGVVFIAESWIDFTMATAGAGDRSAKAIRPSQNRGECIWISAIMRDGQSAESITVFTRGKGGEIIFEPTAFGKDVQANALLPIVRRWEQIKLRPFARKKPPKGR